MSYNPISDFLALLRQTGSVVNIERMPGLDFVVAALSRAGLITLFTGQTAPNASQSTTVWFKPAMPSWTAEGVLFLWNKNSVAYEVATPALWSALLTPLFVSYSFQSAPNPANAIVAGTSLLAIQRVGPTATALILPSLALQYVSNRKLQIVDFSSGVTDHTITLTTSDGSSIMRSATWTLLSNADQLAGITLTPSPDLNAWVITP